MLVAESCGDPGGYVSDSTFHIGLVLGPPDSGRDDGCAVVFRHLIVDGVNLLIVPAAITDYSCLTVVRDQNLGHTAKVVVHVDVGSDPCLLFLVDKSFNVGILAVGHYPYKYTCLNDFAGIRVYDVRRITCPIDLNLLSRLAG